MGKPVSDVEDDKIATKANTAFERVSNSHFLAVCGSEHERRMSNASAVTGTAPQSVSQTQNCAPLLGTRTVSGAAKVSFAFSSLVVEV